MKVSQPTHPGAGVGQRRRRASLGWKAGLFSLLAHLLAAALWLLAGALWPAPVPPLSRARPVSLRSIDSREWATNRGGAVPRQAARAPAELLHPEGQVVATAEGNGWVSPDSKYLAESNNRVAKETRARQQTALYSRPAATTSPAPQSAAPARRPTAPTPPSPGRVDRIPGLDGQKPRLTDLFQAARQGESGEQTAPGDGAIASGGGAPNDDLSNVDEGDGTFLNTREWKYAAFFNRVKQAVSARWDPLGRLRAHELRNRQLGFSDRTTVVNVSLGLDGAMKEVFVAQSSGLDPLDAEAVKAFEKAQPFPNPPTALAEGGLIRFTFGFRVTNEEYGKPALFRLSR